LHLNHPSFTQHNSLADFYKKRILRIFPLYWLAIALVCVEGYHFASPINAFVVIFGLQGFLAQTLEGGMFWWFIGVIIVLYAIFPLITTLGSVSFPPPMESNVLKLAIMLIVPFLILYVANARFFLINGSVLAFYGIFVLGVAVSKYNVLGKYGFQSDNRMRLLKYIVVGAVSFAATLLIFPRLSLRYGFSLIIQNALFLLFVLLAFCLARIIVVSSSKASSPLSQALWYRVLLLISFSSYAIYLFFGPILTPLMYALIGTQLTGFEIDIIQILVGLPIVVLVAYLLQRAQNEIVSKVRKYRTASEPPPDRT
jgi:peptidoglycan/LPS O-acetylase OafA/YrhL